MLGDKEYDWTKVYRTAQETRLRANVTNEQQKGYLKFLNVKDGNIFSANKSQLKSYQAILNTMHYEKRSPLAWMDNKLMSDNIPADVKAKFEKNAGLRQGMYPVWLVFEGMGLKKLSKTTREHMAIEQGHVGTWIVFENKAKRILGTSGWEKARDNIYLFDRKRYLERKELGKITAKENSFINKAVTKEWLAGEKIPKDKWFRTDTREGKMANLYLEFVDTYPRVFKEILSKHMNKAELEKWEKDNHIPWIKNTTYVHRHISDKFKKIYNPRGEQFKKIADAQAHAIAKREGISFDDASTIAWAELQDLMTYSPEKYQSKFLEKQICHFYHHTGICF